MRLDISNQIKRGVQYPLCPIHVLTGSALPIEIMGVPEKRGCGDVVRVKFSVTNADGVKIEAPLKSGNDNIWRGIFSAKNFNSYGFVTRGVSVIIEFIEDGFPHNEKIAVGDLYVLQGSPEATPGSGPSSSPTLGADQYLKSEIVDGVQHYKRVEIKYDEDMSDWGFILVGDFILEGNEMVEV